ncbi:MULTISPECIES: hypothetical protein [Rhizobium]|uniref:hypothetical protein n=1 Tax=Rhizobium TaxID=379 RepID=UPI0019588779|nr:MULTISPECIES: hypothetical protein [Rhizobium]MBM7045869.1 hypothetical protein [Rhizobium lusitanum]
MSSVYIKVEMVGDGQEPDAALMDRIRSLILQSSEVDSISYRSTSIVQTLEAFLTIPRVDITDGAARASIQPKSHRE